MRILHLSTPWTVVIDILAWFLIHMGVVHLMVRIPVRFFDPGKWPFRLRKWEEGGHIYQKAFKIKRWKKILPDGASLAGRRGFPKKRLKEKSPDFLRAFLRETCRAEGTHWVIICFSPLFFLWNPLGVGFFMIFYALAENVPLILAQRYNRARLTKILRD